MRLYEVVYILDPALDESAVTAKLEKFHALAIANGGEVSAVDHWGNRQLAYPLSRQKAGYYVVAQFTAAAEALPEFERLLRLKRRSWRKGLILIAADVAQLEPLILLPKAGLREEILASWPGPVTWLLTAQRGVPAWLGGGRETLAVRVTAHPLARRLCSCVDSPVVSTSANRSGRPPLKRALQVRREFGSGLDDVLVGPLGSLDRPTTLRDGLTGRVLR